MKKPTETIIRGYMTKRKNKTATYNSGKEKFL